MQPAEHTQHRSMVGNMMQRAGEYLHEAQQACTVEGLGQVFTNHIWVVLVNLGQEHKCWDLYTASFMKEIRCQVTSQSARQLQHTVADLHMHSKQHGIYSRLVTRNLQWMQLHLTPWDEEPMLKYHREAVNMSSNTLGRFLAHLSHEQIAASPAVAPCMSHHWQHHMAAPGRHSAPHLQRWAIC